MSADLSTRLMRWGRSLPLMEPAVAMVLTSDLLSDDTFVRECVVTVDDDLAIIDWPAVGQLLDRMDDRVCHRFGALHAAHALATRARQ